MNTQRTQSQPLAERFAEYPPLVRWGLFAVVAIILYLIWDSYIAPTSRAWGAQADRIQDQVRTVRERDRIARQLQALQDTIVTIGPVREPRDLDEGQRDMIDVVNDLRGRFTLSNDTFDTRTRGSLPRGSLRELSVGGQLTRLTGEWRFECRADDAIAIIAALESRPEIDTVSQAQVQRIGNRRVNVRLTIESWVVTGEASRGRT